MLNNRQMCTRLELLHPCQLNAQKSLERQKQSYNAHTHPRYFLIGDPVWVCNFRPGKRWLPGTVKDRNRHANQFRTRLVSLPTNDSSISSDISNHTSLTQNRDNPPVLRHS